MFEVVVKLLSRGREVLEDSVKPGIAASICLLGLIRLD